MANLSGQKIAEKEKISRDPDEWRVLSWMIFIGIAMVITFSFRLLFYLDSSLMSIISSAATGLLLGGAGYAGGGLMGFLFAIPKVLQNTNLLPDSAKSDRTIIIQNDNLVQISDWFTKIIVGVGLTQLYNIPSAILKMGEKLKASFGNDDIGRNEAIAVILYFTIVGFLSIYIWTRLKFLKKLDEANAQLQQRNQQLLKEVVEKEQEIKVVANDNKVKQEDINAAIQTFSSNADQMKTKKEEIKQSPEMPDDPQKGMWGGKAEANKRKVTASVRETSFDRQWFNVNLEVTSTDAKNPLTGDVVFHIHPSFAKDVETIASANGKAELNLLAWGAFTVGVECDNGATKLEIDLAELPDAPQLFKER